MISVVIPTYNRGYIIKRSIDSILNQTYQNIEIIVVDDNSQDNTEEVITALNDKRIKYIKLEENKGACYCRNLGVRNSNGKYIAFQDSDDVWRNNKLENQKAFLEKNNLDVVGCKMEISSEGSNSKTIFPSNINIKNDNIYIKNYISTQLLFGKKECFIEEEFDEKLLRFQDWELVIRLVEKFNVEILDEILVDAYIQDNSITKDPIKAIESLKIFMQKHAKNDLIEANYLRLMGLYSLQAGIEYKKFFKKAFEKNKKDKKVIMDYILSILKLRKLHFNIYKYKGRFN